MSEEVDINPVTDNEVIFSQVHQAEESASTPV